MQSKILVRQNTYLLVIENQWFMHYQKKSISMMECDVFNVLKKKSRLYVIWLRQMRLSG